MAAEGVAMDEVLSPDLYDTEETTPKLKKKAPPKQKKGTEKKAKKPSAKAEKKSVVRKTKGKENEEPKDHDENELDEEVAKVINKKSPAQKKSSLKMQKRKSEDNSGKSPKKMKQSPRKGTKKDQKQAEIGDEGDDGDLSTQPSEEEEETPKKNLGKYKALGNSDAEDAGDEDTPNYIAFSSGDADLKDLVPQAIESLGHFTVRDKSMKNLRNTQVFVMGNNPRRTGRLLEAIARGLWIVRSDWILSSISKGAWQKKEAFEASDVYPGTKASRLARAAGKNLLFAGERFAVLGDSVMPYTELTTLIRISGGVLAQSECDYVIASENATINKKEEPCLDSLIVSEKWFFDCIANWEKQPIP